MQLNRGLAKNAMCCDSMPGQDLGGLNASREAFNEIAEPAPESTKLRHSEFPADFSPSILVGVGVATRPLLTPVPPEERAWVREQILRRMVQVERASQGNPVAASAAKARRGTMHTIMILGAFGLFRWMIREATCVVWLLSRRQEMGNARYPVKH
jgi:hypothetical protein